MVSKGESIMGNEKVCGGSDEDAHAVTVKVLHNPNSGSVPLNTVCSFTEVTGYTVKERFYVATTPIVNMPRPIMLDFYTSSMCIESWGRSSFARCLIEINVDDVLKESLTMGVPLTGGLGFTFETVSIPSTVVISNAHTPTVEKTNHEFQTVSKKKKKGKSKSTNGGQNHPPKATVTSTMEGKITMSNPYSALDDKSEEDVENMYDESDKLFHSTITGENSSTFMAAAG
ncbi:hypothetical protein Tco_0747524 [Tanacetum coccineum]|uniref:Uncharacterized protein n=1 Tax=Tanacetum coccineum TaxID=301880 RepID=A0ABQ4YSY9_9ASTR